MKLTDADDAAMAAIRREWWIAVGTDQSVTGLDRAMYRAGAEEMHERIVHALDEHGLNASADIIRALEVGDE